MSRASFASAARSASLGSVMVASRLCGAPASVLGENTITKLSDRLSHFTSRRLAMRAVTLRPSTFTVTLSPTLSRSPLAMSASKDTSGSPA